MIVNKRLKIIITTLLIISGIFAYTALKINHQYKAKIATIDVLFLSKLTHIKLTSENARIKNLSIENLAQAKSLSYFTSYYKENRELCQGISKLYDLDLRNEQLEPFYSDIEIYINKLHSNPNDKDIAKKFLSFLTKIEIN